jgi:hypothetical protein
MKRIAAIAALAVMGVAGVSTAVLTASGEAAGDDAAIFCSEYVPNAQAESNYAKWLSQNPGEKSRWEPYRDAICSGGSPTPPVMLTAKGRGLVAAGKMALPDAPPPPPSVACADGLDNDADGKIDLADPGCVDAADNDETDPPPPPPSGAALAVSTSGNDSTCARGDLSKPCATFNKAYSIAQCADVVEIAAGSYASQTIVEVAALSSCSQNVVLRPASGASVTVNGGISFGNNNAGSGGYGYDTNAPDHVTLEGVAYSGQITLYGDANFVVIDGVSGGNVLIQGAQDIIVRNSEFGPCASTTGPCGRIHILDGSSPNPVAEPTRTTNILISNNTIHDFLIGQAGDHWECMFNTGGLNVTIERNRFYNCETYAIFIEDNPYSAGTDNWLIQNNWFGRMCNGPVGSQCANTRNSAVYPKNADDVLIRFNSFANGVSVVNEFGSSTNIRVIGNVLGVGVCAAPYFYNYNVFTTASACGSNGLALSSAPYVNASDQAAMNYHLEGAVGSTGADNYVPTSVTDSGLATDFDGQSRPINTNRDAGSDER